MTNKHKIGIHRTTGAKDGYGDAAPHIVCITSFETGDFDEVPLEAIKIYREIGLDSAGYDENGPKDFDRLSDEELVGAAGFWWPQLRTRYEPVQKRYPNVWFKVINEIDNERTIIFMREMCRLAEADGYKLALFGDAGDSPSLRDWTKLWLPFLKEVEGGGHIYVRHAYSGVNTNNMYLTFPNGQPTDDQTKRPIVEAVLMQEYGCRMPMVIGELGWLAGWNSLPPEWLPDLMRYNELLMRLDNVIGVCVWNSGEFNNAPNILNGKPMRELGAKLATMEGVYWDGELIGDVDLVDPLPEPEPPSNPVDAGEFETFGEFLEHIVEAWRVVDYNGNAALQKAMVADGLVPFSSELTVERDGQQYVIQGARRLESAEKRVYYVKHGDWANVQHHVFAVGADGEPFGDLVEPDPVNPWDDFKLGQPLDAPWVITSRFNANRSYGLHEGADVDVTNTAGNSRANVLATNPGTIIHVEKRTSGYGFHVVLRGQHRNEQFSITYAHLEQIFVRQGQFVQAGTPLGEIGNTGNSTGEHLHITLQLHNWGLSGYVRDDVVDPEPFLPNGRLVVVPTLQKKIDLRPYMGKHGNQYMMDILSGDRAGSQEKYRIHMNDGIYLIQKNGLVEAYRFDGNNLFSWLDNSLGSIYQYTVELTGGGLAIRWPLDMAVDQEFWGDEHLVRTYLRKTGQQVNHHAAGIAQNYAKLVSVGDYISPDTGRIYKDVIEMLTGTGETQFWQAGVGPIRWESQWGTAEYALDQGNVAEQGAQSFDFSDVLRQFGVI